VVEADILRQSPAGLLAARITGESRVIEAWAGTRRLSFVVRSAVITENGRPIPVRGPLGALARMEGVELRWMLDSAGRLQGDPEVRGAQRPDDARVHIALLDDLIQASGFLPEESVDVGATWRHPWRLHGLSEGVELEGELASTLSALNDEEARVGLEGALVLPRQDLEDGWTIEGRGTARGESRVSSTTGVLLGSRLVIRVETDATSPDGIDSELVVVAELWIREPADVDDIPADSLLSCDARLAELAAPLLSPTATGEDFTLSRSVDARIASAGGEPIDVPAIVVRLEADGAWIDGEATGDVLLWAHDAHQASGTVYLDIAPDVPLSRVLEVAGSLGSPRLLLGNGENLDVASLAARVNAAAGDCGAMRVAAATAPDETLLRPGFALLAGARSALGACGCTVGDVDAATGLVSELRRSLVEGLRYLALDRDALPALLARAPEGATASDIVSLLSAPVEAASEPTPIEESK